MSSVYKPTLVRRLVNSGVTVAVKAGITPRRTQLLSVPGRRSGTLYTTPVNLVLRDDHRFLVAPYGERSWVKNARKAGAVRLRHGTKQESVAIEPVVGPEAASVLRQYLRENTITRPFFDTTADAPDEAFLAEVPAHPVFRLRKSDSGEEDTPRSIDERKRWD